MVECRASAPSPPWFGLQSQDEKHPPPSSSRFLHELLMVGHKCTNTHGSWQDPGRSGESHGARTPNVGSVDPTRTRRVTATPGGGQIAVNPPIG
jgi:hypothetical protein